MFINFLVSNGINGLKVTAESACVPVLRPRDPFLNTIARFACTESS